MDPSAFSRFESYALQNPALKQSWDSFYPNINTVVEDVEKARFIYSYALKISRNVAKEPIEIKAIWMNLLGQASFTLRLENTDSRQYTFTAIIDLVKAEKEQFETKLTKIDPKKDNLEAIAKATQLIFLESIGQTPETEFFHQILTSKDTFCVVAKENEAIVGCSYGTHVNVNGIEIFHLNFLGRRIEYPSLNLPDSLRKQFSVLQEQYPDLHYLTLCVAVTNTHMISLYEKEGFEKQEYLDNGPMGFPVFFYAKKLNPAFDLSLPSYEKFQSAMKEKREEQKREFLLSR